MGSEVYSSGEEDGDADWKKAINSVADASFNSSSEAAETSLPEDGRQKAPKPKHYQIKIQKLLDEMLEKSLVMVRNDDDGDGDVHVADPEALSDGCDQFRLFKHSIPGISLHYVDDSKPRKRPKILPGEDIDEKSKKFKRRLKSVSVDGEAIMAAAESLGHKSLARLEAKDLAAKEVAKKEEERVAGLKKVRGEKWLPSLARQKMYQF